MNKVREWKTFLTPYEQAVEELKVKFKSIRREFRDVNDYSPIEFVTGRVKKISSILEKAKRRSIDEKNIAEEMEDIAGIRIMCQFIDDIYRVVKLIHARNDMRVVYEKDYISSPKESGYKSFHVIIKYPIQTIYGEKEILAEIQIRTLAMNFWATIEHSLNYKYPQQIPEDISKKLRNAADAASALDQEMYLIRHEIIQAQLLFEQKSNIITDITNNIQNLIKIGKNDEAEEFQKQFEEVWETSNIDDLDALSKKIKDILPRYQMFTDKKDI
jgi:putative GTP pyrophosphokinase